MLEVLEQVAREPQLRGRDGAAPRELERERRLPVVQDEAVVVGERRSCSRGPQRRGLAVDDDRQLERAVERDPPARVALADDAAVLVDERERAAEAVAQDREQRRHSAPVEHGLREALVHLERAREVLELLARRGA